MKHLIIISIFLLLSSCGHRSWLNRGVRKNWIDKDSIIIRDTIRGFDTTIIRQFDTLTSVDTFEVVKNGVKVKTVIQWKDRIIEQRITERDTIIENVCPPEVKCPAQKKRFDWWCLAFFTMVAVWIITLLKR